MKTKVKIKLSYLLLIAILAVNCSNPIKKIQGVYVVKKDSLKETLKKQFNDDNTFANNLLNIAIENAVFEFEIQNDSINGLLFLAGESSIITSKITLRNDSMVFKLGETEAYLIPTSDGLIFRNINSDLNIELIKSDLTKLSPETVKAIDAQKKAELELKEFEENLGRWKEGYFVDEFGDKTGEGYAYCIVRGTHEISISMGSEVYIKSSIMEESLTFQIFNSSMSLKENFPDSEFGSIRIKFPDGTVVSERIFFFNNTASESPRDNNNLIFSYLSKNDGELKLLIDLSTASEYYSDKYQFNLKKNNLIEILEKLNK